MTWVLVALLHVAAAGATTASFGVEAPRQQPRDARQLQAAIDEAIATGAPSVAVAGGTYNFSAAACSSLHITNADKLTLLAPSPVLFLFSGSCGVNVSHSRFVTLGNFSIDYADRTQHVNSAITLHLFNCSHVTLEGVNILHAPYMALTAFNGVGAHTIRRLKFVPTNLDKPCSALSPQTCHKVAMRDAIHFSDERIGSTFEDCIVGYAGDDFFNVHTSLMLVLRCKGRSCYVINPHNCQDRKSGRPCARNTVYASNSAMSMVEAGDKFSMFSWPDKSFQTTKLTTGGELTVASLHPVTDKAVLKQAAAIVPLLTGSNSAGPGALGSTGWTSMTNTTVDFEATEVWQVEFEENVPDGAKITDIIQIDSISNKGTVMRRMTFTNSTCNLGRWKSSDSVLEDSTFANAAIMNLEFTWLTQFFEGPLEIKNVTVRNVTVRGEGPHPVHCGPFCEAHGCGKGSREPYPSGGCTSCPACDMSTGGSVQSTRWVKDLTLKDLKIIKSDDESSTTGALWRRGNLTTVSVNMNDGSYSVAVAFTPWLNDGAVAVRCGGKRYTSGDGSLKLVGGGAVAATGYEAYRTNWSAPCAALTTEVRYFSASDSFDFVTTMLSAATGTNSMPASTRLGLLAGGRYRSAPGSAATEFPSFALPSAEAGLGFVEWNGNALGTMTHMQRPQGELSANFSKFVGGLVAGPLLIYGGRDGSAEHPNAIVLAPSSAFTVGRMMNVKVGGGGERIVGGAHGMVTSLPAGYNLSFQLSGRAGINAALSAFGRTLQQRYGSPSTKMTLEDDVLSRELSYLADNGANYCFCRWFRPPNFKAVEKPPFILDYCKQHPTFAGCVPIYKTLRALKAYHASLKLKVGVYHLDPFWYSQEPLGMCSAATNMSASPYHFGDKTMAEAVGLDMQLFVSTLAADNIYRNEYAMDGSQVAGNESLRFYTALFSHHAKANRLRALVWDGVDEVWLSSERRVQDVYEQALWQAGYAKAALDVKLPMRVDQHQPFDILASVQFGAHTVSRCTGDSPTGGGDDSGHWPVLNGNSIFISSLGVRPMLDVLWSTSSQPGNPYKQSRKDVAHDFIVAALSTGPIGIGDNVNCTDKDLIDTATRADGVILKPAAAAVRLDRFYTLPRQPSGQPLGGRFEVTAAPSSLAASASSKFDAVADSRAVLGESGSDVWSWNILSVAAPESASAECWGTGGMRCGEVCIKRGHVKKDTAYGLTLVGSDTSALTVEACCAACNASPKCQFWNLNFAPHPVGCFFKAGPVTSQPASLHGVTSGVRTGSLFPQGALPLRLAELWPTPPAGTEFFVHEWQNASCVNGSAASSCLTKWSEGSALDINASRSTHGYQQLSGKYRYFRASPVLKSGWSIMGEFSKVVPVSPQRLLLTQTQAAGVAAGMDRFSALGKRSGADELAFEVIGAPSEAVELALVTPDEKVLLVRLALSGSGRGSVRCSNSRCVGSASAQKKLKADDAQVLVAHAGPQPVVVTTNAPVLRWDSSIVPGGPGFGATAVVALKVAVTAAGVADWTEGDVRQNLLQTWRGLYVFESPESLKQGVVYSWVAMERVVAFSNGSRPAAVQWRKFSGSFKPAPGLQSLQAEATAAISSTNASKLWAGSWNSVHGRIMPSGFLPTSVSGGYGGITSQFVRDASGQLLGLIESAKGTQSSLAVPKAALRFMLGQLKTFYRPGKSFDSYAPHVMRGNKNLTKIVSLDTTDEADDTGYLIAVWGRYCEVSGDEAMRADYFPLLANYTEHYLAKGARSLGNSGGILPPWGGNVPYWNETLSLIWNPNLEHSRLGSYWSCYDSLTNSFAAESLRCLAVAADKLQLPAEAARWRALRAKIVKGIESPSGLTYEAKAITGEKAIYGELRGHENSFREDKDEVGYSPLLWGLSYENVVPMVLGLSLMDPALNISAATMKNRVGLDVEKMDATYRTYKRLGSLQWVNQDESHSAFVSLTHLNSSGWADPPPRSPGPSPPPPPPATPCDESRWLKGEDALKIGTGTDNTVLHNSSASACCSACRSNFHPQGRGAACGSWFFNGGAGICYLKAPGAHEDNVTTPSPSFAAGYGVAASADTWCMYTGDYHSPPQKACPKYDGKSCACPSFTVIGKSIGWEIGWHAYRRNWARLLVLHRWLGQAAHVEQTTLLGENYGYLCIKNGEEHGFKSNISKKTPRGDGCWGDPGNGVQIGWYLWGEALARKAVGLPTEPAPTGTSPLKADDEASAVAKPNCRCLPGNPCWLAVPWSALNASIGGRLERSIDPIRAPCSADLQSQACSNALEGSDDEFWLGSKPNGYQHTGIFGEWNISAQLSSFAVRAETEQDFVETVKFAGKHNLRLVIKATGHDWYGRSTAAGSLLLWTHKRKKITWHSSFPAPEGNVPAVTVESGVQFSDIYPQAQARPFPGDTAIPQRKTIVMGGGCDSVGVSGCWLGGCYNVFTKKFGDGANNLLQATLVLPNGTLITASESENADVFWSLRGGGGGNIAAVTDFTARTHPAPQHTSRSSFSGSAKDLRGFKVLLRCVLKGLAESNSWPLDLQATSGTPAWRLFNGNTTVFEASLLNQHWEGDPVKLKALYKPMVDWCLEPAQQALGITCSSRASITWNQTDYVAHSKIWDNASFIPKNWVGNEPWISYHADREISTSLLGSLSKYIPMSGCTNDTRAAEMIEGIIKIETVLNRMSSKGCNLGGYGTTTGVHLLGVGRPTGDKSQSGMPAHVVARSKKTSINPVLLEAPAFWLIMLNIPSLPSLPPSSRLLKSMWPRLQQYAVCSEADPLWLPCEAGAKGDEEKAKDCMNGWQARVPRFRAQVEEVRKLLCETFPNEKDGEPYSGSYWNEADYSDPEWQISHWGASYNRLFALKKQHDPHGLYYGHHAVGSELWDASGNCRAAPLVKTDDRGAICSNASLGDACCSLNGLYADNECACVPPWWGENCEKMRFKPQSGQPAYGTPPVYDSAGTRVFYGNFSWGGNPVFAGDSYHLFAAMMPPGHNLSEWGSSLVDHAISPNVSGPYVYNQTTLTPGHNPAIIKLRNGSFALFSILDYGVHVSDSPFGSWTKVVQAQDCKTYKQPLCYCNNPSPWLHKNGTIFLACGGGGPNVDGLWRSSNLTGPWTRVYSHATFNHIRADGNRPPVGGGFEDPHLWFDANDNLHLLFHAFCNEPAVINASCHGTLTSAHAFSTGDWSSDIPGELSWAVSPSAPYNSSVTTAAGKTLYYWSRERPKLVWDDAGKMTHLITAVAPQPRAEDPATLRFSSCRKGTPCSNCKGQVFTETLFSELDVAPLKTDDEELATLAGANGDLALCPTVPLIRFVRIIFRPNFMPSIGVIIATSSLVVRMLKPTGSGSLEEGRRLFHRSRSVSTYFRGSRAYSSASLASFRYTEF